MNYPETKTIDCVEQYHGTAVADPYRWLEDGDSDETAAWIASQVELTTGYLEGLPDRERLRERLTEIWNYAKYSAPSKRGDRYLFYKNDGLQNQSVLYVLEDLGGEPRVLLDPNTLSEDGTVALGGVSIDPSGKYMAYGLSQGGSDWRTWRVRDIETGEDLGDTLEWSKFSGAAWTHDAAGFYYCRYDAPTSELQDVNEFQKLCYHRLGTPQSEDALVLDFPEEPQWGSGADISDDGRYLVVAVWRDTTRTNRFYYRDLSDPSAELVELIDNFDAAYDFIDNDGTRFWFETNDGAPKGKVVEIDVATGARRELIPETGNTIRSVSTLGGRFYVAYLVDAKNQVEHFALDGSDRQVVELPGIGSIGGFSGKRTDTETFYVFTSFTTPTTIYRYDCATGKSEIFRQPDVNIDCDRFVTEQVFYESKDGTRVPMFVTHLKTLERDGTNPTYLYGYGGFNVSLTPSFSVSQLLWIEQGGILAIPNLRGGGEYGEAWHEAGMKDRKQNVFDDFIAAGEWLIAEGYTTKEKLAIGGGSNGGLLVGACMVQRPDLFAAALPAVGVLDMLRFHKFTIGWAWCSEYGTPEDPDEFPALYAYSPLHNLKPGTAYPSTMVITADRDDRVVPAHSFKFAAALQAANGGDRPQLIRIETRAGHGAGKPTSKQIEEVVDKWAFLLQALGHTNGLTLTSREP
ncbi:MAG: prolyl oligopeptidase family protein [Geitlerinemataceae cyanobacterium]|mgnify:FL=1